MAIDVSMPNGARKIDQTENGPNPDPPAATEEDEYGVTEIESLCMNCHEDGTTRLKIVRIPFFREVLLESFDCPHCSYRNTSIKSAGEIQPLGSKYTFRLDTPTDLQRQVVKNETATVSLSNPELEMPTGSGQLTTIEGLITKTRDDLQSGQDERASSNLTLHTALNGIITSLTAILAGTGFPTTLTLDDPSGNSLIEPSPTDTSLNNKYTHTTYPRTHAQNLLLGLTTTSQPPSPQPSPPLDSALLDPTIYSLPSPCPACTSPTTTNIHPLTIPHFRDVIIISTSCDSCGYATRDVKTGGEVPDKGERIELRVLGPADLNRDVLKSETCAVECAEVGVEVGMGGLGGGRFTTVEGLLSAVRAGLRGGVYGDDDDEKSGGTANATGEIVMGLQPGDSMLPETKARWDGFFERLDRAIRGEMEVTLVLKDPMGASYVQDLVDDGEDPQVVRTRYERTEEEEEALGFRDMKTEGYEVEGGDQ